MPVRRNPFKAALSQGKVQVGTWIMMVRNPAVLSLLKSIGLDYARLDLEHTPLSMETVADMAVLARALDFSLVVRPPEANREWITRLLDAGVWNLHFPQVDTPDTARRIVEAVYHYPMGNRGTWEPGPQNDYTYPGDPTGSLRYLNEQVHVTVMLESVEAFEHVDEIVSMPGIDAVTLGPADLAQELGIYDTVGEARIVAEYMERLHQVAIRHGKTFCVGVWSLEDGERWIRAGAKVVNYQTDTFILRQGLKAAVDRFALVRAE